MAADVAVVTFVEVPAVAFDPLIPSEEAVVELAELGCFVARLLSDLGEEDFFVRNGKSVLLQFCKLSLILLFGDLSSVALDGETPTGLRPAALAGIMHAGEEGPAGGGTKDGAVVVGEAHALGSETIEVGSLDELLALGAKEADAEVVGEDENDVWLGLLFR